MGVDPEAFKALQQRMAAKKPSAILGEVVKARGKTKPRERGMNKTEAAYDRYLGAHPDVVFYAFEPVKLRLADSCSLTPDFMVMLSDGSISFRDTKAYWQSAKKVGVTDDSLAKMKVAAEMYPMFTFTMTWKKDGIWEERVF
jgi:hypothetical protein